MCVCVCLCLCACTFMCVCVCPCAYVRMSMLCDKAFVCTRVCTFVGGWFVWMCAFIFAHLHKHIQESSLVCRTLFELRANPLWEVLTPAQTVSRHRCSDPWRTPLCRRGRASKMDHIVACYQRGRWCHTHLPATPAVANCVCDWERLAVLPPPPERAPVRVAPTSLVH